MDEIITQIETLNSLLSDDFNKNLQESCNAAIQKCEDSLLVLAQSAQDFIDAHDRYRLENEYDSYTLKEKMEKLDEEGKIWFKDLGYYTTLGDLAIGLIRKETRR